MSFDFETMVNRTGTGNMKGSLHLGLPDIENPLVLSGAEMDYATAPVIRKALAEFAERGIYGFTLPDKRYREAVCEWIKRVRGSRIHAEDIVVTMGTVKGISTAVRAFTEPGDGVIIQHPSYYRFDVAVRRNGRKVIENPMIERKGVYEIDFADLEQKMALPDNKLLILCNPHNPTGKVFRPEELKQIACLARKYQVVVLSDEIFAETAQPGHEAVLYTEIEPASIVSTSLGKCFNFTGVNQANLIIPDQKLRERYVRQRDIDHFGSIDPFFYTALIAGYSAEGYEWIRQMNRHTRENYCLLADSMREHCPEIVVSPLEGGFVSWLDLSDLGMTDMQMNQWFLQRLCVLADPGNEYGTGGMYHVRLNLATPKGQILEFLRRFYQERRVL